MCSLFRDHHSAYQATHLESQRIRLVIDVVVIVGADRVLVDPHRLDGQELALSRLVPQLGAQLSVSLLSQLGHQQVTNALLVAVRDPAHLVCGAAIRR